MFVVGVCIGDESAYQQIALRSLLAGDLHDSVLIEMRNQVSIHAAYNAVLQQARELPELEGVILVHQDLEMRDRHVVEKLRKIFLDQSVGVVGAVGAVGVQTLSWWLGDIKGSIAETRQVVGDGCFDVDVDMVDGCFLALSPDVARKLQFDEVHYTGFHGYDAEICFAARSRGFRVVTGEFDLFHATKGGYGDYTAYCLNNDSFREKWVLCDTPELSSGRLGLQHNRRKLEIGGGSNCREGWLNLDPIHGTGDLRRRAEDGVWPLGDGLMMCIYASHVMEQIPAGQVRIHVMNEAWRVLEPTGTLEIRVPLFPTAVAIADPTHVSFWIPDSIKYFIGASSEPEDYGIQKWNLASMAVLDGWELRCVLVKPLDRTARVNSVVEEELIGVKERIMVDQGV
ncbi:glycosyltransferase [Ferrimicrobium sp.]|uniref:glycosyltransferase n=1 Tax=Ferrimicrobium sp. TaxID=2926050 RepID=UPI00262DAA55|nr:glycosyltransferase [Ferrimicrobium sp.]